MALNDISLTAGMRSNLLSLQSTTTLLDRTQSRLASGKKVNTALDNPTNFFAAQNHTQRAEDLTSRKDGMSEAIQGVKAADKGISGITALIEAAKGLIQSARSADTAGRENLAEQFNTIRDQITSLASDSVYKGKNFLKGNTLDVLFNENGGSKLTIAGFDATASGLTVTAVTLGSSVVASTAAGIGASGVGVTNTKKVVLDTFYVATTIDPAMQTFKLSGSIIQTRNSGTTVAHAAKLDTASTAIAAKDVFNGSTGLLVADSGGQTVTLNFSGSVSGITGASPATGITIKGVTITNMTLGTYQILTGADLAAVVANFDNLASSGAAGAVSGALLSGLTGTTLATGYAVSFTFTVAAHTASGGFAVNPNVQAFNLATGDVMTGVKGAGVIGTAVDTTATGTAPAGYNVYVNGTFAAENTYKISGQKIVFTGTAIPASGAVTYTYSKARELAGTSGAAGYSGTFKATHTVTTLSSGTTAADIRITLGGVTGYSTAATGTKHITKSGNIIKFASGVTGTVAISLAGNTGTTTGVSAGQTVKTAGQTHTGTVKYGVSGTATAISGGTGATYTVAGSTTISVGSGVETARLVLSTTANLDGDTVASVTVGSTTLTTGFTVSSTSIGGSGTQITFSREFASGLSVSYKTMNASGDVSASKTISGASYDTTAAMSGNDVLIYQDKQQNFTVTDTLNSQQSITAVALSGVTLSTGKYSVSGNTIKFNSGFEPANGVKITYTITTTSGDLAGAWATDAGLDTSLSQLDAGLATLRTQSAALASNLNVVATRQEFTDGMINTLLKGADNLTLADMNEEGANMLMLQTRQQLSTTSLKMASDAAQAVLRLF